MAVVASVLFAAAQGDAFAAVPNVTSVVNGFSSQPSFSPGLLVSIIGEDLNGSNLSVTVGGQSAAVIFASAGQINVQFPFDTALGAASVVVSHNGGTSNAVPVVVEAYAPAFSMNLVAGPNIVFAIAADGAGITPENPAAAGEVATIYLGGLGQTNPAAPDAGATTPLSPPFPTIVTPTIEIAGLTPDLIFAGLAPGFAAVYEATFIVPPLAPSGTQSISVSIGGFTSPDGTLIPIGSPARDNIGVFREGGWLLDSDGDGAADLEHQFGWDGVTRLTGDWDGDGRDEIGIFINGFWYLDANGDGLWDGGVADKAYQLGWNGVTPFVGDWNGDGRDKIGIFINGFWFLDFDGNGVWGGPAVDRQAQFGWNGVTPFVGDWNGDGTDKIGIFINGFWFLDLDGDGLWEGPGGDRQAQFGWNGVTPLVGDWNGSGPDRIGIFINGIWYLDVDGDGLWDGPSVDRQAQFGWNGVTPLVGDWNADRRDKIGIFIDGVWYLDFDGTATWDGGVNDKAYSLGEAGDLPTIGRWQTE